MDSKPESLPKSSERESGDGKLELKSGASRAERQKAHFFAAVSQKHKAAGAKDEGTATAFHAEPEAETQIELRGSEDRLLGSVGFMRGPHALNQGALHHVQVSRTNETREAQVAVGQISLTSSLEMRSVWAPGSDRAGIEVAVPGEGLEQVRLRAVVDREGKIHATVVTQSEASHQVLSAATQHITAFLETERVRLDSLTVSHAQLQNGFGSGGEGSRSATQQNHSDERPSSRTAKDDAVPDGVRSAVNRKVDVLPALAGWASSDAHGSISVRA